MDTVVNAGSWTVAVEFTRAAPGLQVFETHPGGGQYDCLTLVDADVKIDINRVGSIHAHASPTGEHTPLIPAEQWQAMLARPGGAAAVAETVAAGCGMPWAAHRPATTARLLQYRVISRLLASRAFSRAEWDVRSRFHDSSGPGGCSLVGTTPGDDVDRLDPRQVWRVLRAGTEVAWLWDGWAWTLAGDRTDLMSAYRRGATVDQLVAVLTTPPGTERAGRRPTERASAPNAPQGAP